MGFILAPAHPGSARFLSATRSPWHSLGRSPGGLASPDGGMAEEHLGPVGVGIAVRQKPDSGFGRSPREATTRCMAKSASAGSRGSPITQRQCPD